MMLKAFKYSFEEEIRNEIKKLDGKGAVTMSILERRELLGMEKGMKKGIERVAKNLLKEGAEIALVVKANYVTIYIRSMISGGY